jgi:hypothetical protein
MIWWWRLWKACLVVLVFGAVFGFIPLLPWGLLVAELLFLWWGRLSGNWPQAAVEPVLREPHDLLEGDAYVVGEVPSS